MNTASNGSTPLRLGIWGLGRGADFYDICDALNVAVVTGCDLNEPMRQRCRDRYPDAYVTDDADAFLSRDFDAVLLATYCPAHADDAIRCLNAGKHVLSEVTAFHTMSEGVRLVEAVERSGLVYNLAENYPFTANQMYVAQKYAEGLFGEMIYAEGEYVHEVRRFNYTYNGVVPIEPGWSLHNWRSWLHWHYYCTHSLGPIMHITGARPVRVVALPVDTTLPGCPPTKGAGLSGMAPSLITLSNGTVFKNLMGGSTMNSGLFRYWGTKGSAEISTGLFLQLGSGGHSPRMEMEVDMAKSSPVAANTGHGGGDFWPMYYFIKHIQEGVPAPFDVYRAADSTMAGLLAYRSAQENGKPYDVPDFRIPAERDCWRNDQFAQPRYDTQHGCFPEDADKALISRFNTIAVKLIDYAETYRAHTDWHKVIDDVKDPDAVRALPLPPDDAREVLDDARTLVDAYPDSDGARILRELLSLVDEI